MKEPFRPEEAVNRQLELFRLRDEINKASEELTERVRRLNTDVMTARNNPEVREIWSRLCRLHMKAMVSCTYDSINHDAVKRICDEFAEPRACMNLLQLSEEQTCCARFLQAIM